MFPSRAQFQREVFETMLNANWAQNVNCQNEDAPLTKIYQPTHVVTISHSSKDVMVYYNAPSMQSAVIL